ncbi:MAG: tetratricopeptide repeat protein [Nitrospira sp.]|nr:tetratricopeptide repeat protein [Nitrospira sp.]
MVNRLIFTVFLILPQFVIDVCASHAGENIENLKAGVVKITSTFGGISRLGTGAIIKIEQNSVYIITAAHVVEGDPNPLITFYTSPHHPYSSRIIGLEGDNPKGLAVMIVEDKISIKLKELSVDQTMLISGGEKGILIGFPRVSGKPWMVTPATLGGQYGRDLAFSGNADEGNSGGPIFIDGRVVGIITHMADQFGNAAPAVSIIQALKGWDIFPQVLEEQRAQKSDESKSIRLLEKEVLFKSQQIEYLFQQLLPYPRLEPSPLARKIAKTIPQDSDPYILALKSIGEENYENGRNYLDQAIQNHQTELGKAFLAYGRIEETNFQFNRAEEWHKKALQESPKDPDIMERLGHVLIQNFKLMEAETNFLQALSISEKLYGETHSKVIGLKNYLGWVSHGLGKNAQALSLEKEALLGWKVSKGPEHHMVGISFTLIGQIYTSLGEFEKADEAFLKGIEILEKDPSTDRGTLGGFWCLTAVSPLMSQQYEKAIPLLIQGISISAESDFYSDWLCHFFLGFAYGAQHQWNLAEKNTEKALLLAQENMEPKGSTVALTSLTMAAIYFDQKRLMEAQPLAMIGVEILDNRLKPNYYGPPFLLDLLILGNHILGQNDKVAALVKTRIKSHGFTNIFSQMLENLGVKIR